MTELQRLHQHKPSSPARDFAGWGPILTCREFTKNLTMEGFNE